MCFQLVKVWVSGKGQNNMGINLKKKYLEFIHMESY